MPVSASVGCYVAPHGVLVVSLQVQFQVLTRIGVPVNWNSKVKYKLFRRIVFSSNNIDQKLSYFKSITCDDIP